MTPEDNPQPIETELIRSLADKVRGPNEACPSPAQRSRVLALSGGGMYGAYSVGVLAGWTASGTRPEFDVVTGVSTGGLIATYAFLGTEYDRQMVESYTSISERDIYRKRPWELPCSPIPSLLPRR